MFLSENYKQINWMSSCRIYMISLLVFQLRSKARKGKLYRGSIPPARFGTTVNRDK